MQWKTTVEDFPMPTTQRTVRQFLGLTSYLRRYVHMAKGLLKLQNHWMVGLLTTGSTKPKKNSRDAFDALKWKLVEAPILHT